MKGTAGPFPSDSDAAEAARSQPLPAGELPAAGGGPQQQRLGGSRERNLAPQRHSRQLSACIVNRVGHKLPLAHCRFSRHGAGHKSLSLIFLWALFPPTAAVSQVRGLLPRCWFHGEVKPRADGAAASWDRSVWVSGGTREEIFTLSCAE